MAPNDSPFRTQGNMDATDLGAFRQLIREFVGDPQLSSVLGDVFEKAFGRALSSNVQMFAGATMPFGSSSLFGPQQTGANMMSWMQDQSVSAAMGQSNRVIAELRQKQTEDYLMAFGGATSRASAQALSERFTFTGMLSNFMFGQMQPELLQRGLEEGSRYMGSSGLGFDPITLERQRTSGRLTASVSADYLSNPQEYYGLKGADVGRLFAEMGRTGQLGQIARTNEGMLGPGGTEAAIIESTREAARAVQSFRQIFRGSVTDVLDQVNSLMGMDVVGTFDDQGRSLLQNMASAGAVAGFAPQQMAALGGISRQISGQAGMQPWGSAATATMAAQIIGTQRQGGWSSDFVRPMDFRNDVLVRTTGAQQSGLARDISGAYALMDKDSRKGFLEYIRGMDPDEALTLTPERLARYAGDGVTGFDIRDASFTAEAEKARAQGIGLQVSARHNAAAIQDMRMGMLRATLRNAGIDSTDVLSALGDRAITEETLTDALQGVEGDTQIRGQLMRRFALQAEALGFKGGARGVGQYLATMYDQSTMQQVLRQTEYGRELMDVLGGRGAQGGLAGVNQYITKLSESGDESRISGFVQAALGGPGKDLTAQETLSLFGDDISNLQGFLDQDVSGGAAMRQSAARLGANLALKTLLTREYRGKAANKEQIAQARKLLSGFAGDPSALIEYARGTVEDPYQRGLFENQIELEKMLGDAADGADADILKKAAGSMTVLEQIGAEKEFVSKELQGKTGARFKSTSTALLSAYEKNLQVEKGRILSFDEFKKSWEGWGEDGRMQREKYNELLETESARNEDIGAPSSTLTGIGAILDLLNRILSALQENIPKSTPDGEGGTEPNA